VTYWLDLFTGMTWDEFRRAGASVSGFRERMRKAVGGIRKGDILLCYLTGVMRWVGALEVLGPSKDQSPIWKDDDFPMRLQVRPLILLDPEHGVPMEQLEGRLEFYAGLEHRGGFKGFLRMSPNRFRRESDGALILDLLKRAKEQPVSRPVDPKKLARRPTYMFKAERRTGKRTIPTLVSVPEPDESVVSDAPQAPVVEESVVSTTRHTEIQYHLLKLGAEMGLDVWVARNDRSRTWNGETLGEMSRILSELPTQFNDATTRTIELIDVLWLKGNSIVAAFEVESTTSIYSGLLRMSDLLALQPNLDIRLYLVAPDERRIKVAQEILRPTFSLRDRPLPEICGYLPFSTLVKKIEGIRELGLASSLKPDFLEKTAEFFGEESPSS
jgi:hypothetical protein